MENRFELIVIGAGPGGYTAAIKAAKLGLKTAIVEEREVGGTCLNRGCIPAKAMLHSSALYREIQEGEQFGIFASDVRFDYDKILSYKEETTTKLSQGVEQLLKANKATLLRGQGILLGEGQVTVKKDGEEKIYEAGKIILAGGSKPLKPPIEGLDLPGVVTSDELFQAKAVPESLLIIGGGVISVEFATIFKSLGAEVTIVEAMPRIIPNTDKEISQSLKMILKKREINVHVGASVQRIEQNDQELVCVFIEKEKEVKISASCILCAVGRGPNTAGLFADGVTLETERGRLVVNQDFCTSIPNVYAIGDLIPGAQLAHTASAQGMYTVEKIAGKTPSIDLNAIPICVYTDPEIASVGMTEEEAKEKGITVTVGKFIMNANGKSLISREERGFIKVVANGETQVVLGAQMMCARATDMIGEIGTAVANELTVQQMLRAMRAHPTYNEGLGEALEDVIGEAIHVMPKRNQT